MDNPILAKATRLYQAKRWDEARKALDECRRRHPDALQACNLLGLIGLQVRDFTAAREAFEAGLKIDARNPELWHNLGLVMAEVQQPVLMERCLRAALEAAPEQHASRLMLARCVLGMGRIEDAFAQVWPLAGKFEGNPEYHFILGTCLLRLNRLEEAEAALRRTLELAPGMTQGLNNLGVTLRLQGRLDEAVAVLDESLRSAPQNADAHVNQATIHLLRGNLEEGWKEFEWRFASYRLLWGAQDLTMPPWHGEERPGDTILLLAEQGMGDTIQFIRLAPLVKARFPGGRVVVEVQAPMARLLRGADGIDQILIRGQPRPPFQTYASLMGLSRHFLPTIASIPAPVPYLARELARTAPPPPRPGERPLRVGVVWAGSGAHAENRARSCPAEALLPLREVPGVEVVALQKFERPEEAERNPFPDAVAGCKDFLDTAGVVAGLDLVVSVDTAVAHLAGAMARPLWLLLPKNAEWRWLLERADTPWYPTARLFRQARANDWAELGGRVARELAEAARTGHGLLPSPSSPPS